MKKRILVIDDDRLVLRTVKQLLERSDYEVVSANGADEAVKLAGSEEVNLIICDIRMPQADGLCVIKQIKALFQSKNQQEVPVIFITGYASDDAPIEAIKLGAKDYILKPFDLDELLASVRRYIEK